MQGELDRLLVLYKKNRENLITILQKVQEKIGYLSEEAISKISKLLGISEAQVFGVATFYAQFRFAPPGKHNIKVCLGTACHVRGGTRIMEEVERDLKIKPGETTPDYEFDLERVACFGCCALAPVVVIDNKVYAQMTSTKVKKILTQYKK
jgi:NADH-quinone oxidoreductase subunit E